MRRPTLALAFGGLIALLSGCATTKPFDYTNFREHRPRSILVLPPLNESTDVRGTYSYLSTVTRPLAEMGYYVFPVAVVDEFLKENGLPGPGEMHAAPLDKLASIFGTDSVLYITVKQYGQKYRILGSVAVVSAYAKLVDARTGMLLWEGASSAQLNSNNGGGLIGALISAAITQAFSATADTSHVVSRDANYMLFTPFRGGGAGGSGGPPLLYGPYRPEAVAAQ